MPKMSRRYRGRKQTEKKTERGKSDTEGWALGVKLRTRRYRVPKSWALSNWVIFISDLPPRIIPNSEKMCLNHIQFIRLMKTQTVRISGIQHAVGGLASKPERDLLMQDFMTVETTNFPSEGSNHTPAHHYSEFKFKNYAPIAFRYFRDLFGIQPDDFLVTIKDRSRNFEDSTYCVHSYPVHR